VAVLVFDILREEGRDKSYLLKEKNKNKDDLNIVTISYVAIINFKSTQCTLAKQKYKIRKATFRIEMYTMEAPY
jgi:hypothetical protein